MGHLRDNGFDVEVNDVDNLMQIKSEHGVESHVMSCHTAIVDGYVIEGHVPANALERLLAERPDIAGLSVPGMPVGPPGMEGPNPQDWQVLAFDEDGNTTVWEQH